MSNQNPDSPKIDRTVGFKKTTLNKLDEYLAGFQYPPSRSEYINDAIEKALAEDLANE